MHREEDLTKSRLEASFERSATPRAPRKHAYPADLGAVIAARWDEEARREPSRLRHATGLLPQPLLEQLLSTCFQASLLRDEGRPVAFRLVVGAPAWFRAEAGPPTGFLRLIFDRDRPLDTHELRRLVPAAGFHRSLVGVQAKDDELMIWGLVDSGPRWLQSVRGGRDIDQLVPPLLTIAVTGPGRIAVSRGAVPLAELFGGSLRHNAMDVFDAPWLGETFRNPPSVKQLAPPEVAFIDELSLHVLRRIVATIREGRHGGMLVFVPPEDALAFDGTPAPMRLKYRFADEEPRRRLQTLIARIARELDALPTSTRDQWHDYEATTNTVLHSLDEALFEIAHFIAGFANVDGAVVMTTDLEILGFGGEVSGSLPSGDRVAHALDLDGNSVVYEPTDAVGMRHRSAYRLCDHLPGTLAVVLSQDGGVRFVRRTTMGVTFWDQFASSPWES